MAHKILVFTKAKSTASMLQQGLEKRGFIVSITGNKQKMLAWASEGWADFLLVDASNSLEKGLELCTQLRACDENAHIVMAIPTRRRVISEAVDACFVAPITLRKVQYRLKLLLQTLPRYLLRVGDVVFDPKHRIVRREDQKALLRPKEARLLHLLMERAGKVVTREDIMTQVWDTAYTGDTRTIDVHIHWLRQKIEPVPAKPIYIRTVRRQGYLFCDPSVVESKPLTYEELTA